MVTEDQHEVIAFLQRPETYGPGCAHVDQIVTHSAVVFLAGRRALKLKRAVRYDYLDFSTAERRRHCCAAEVTVNRRLAPALYRGVVVVTREARGGLTLGGSGTPVDWLVDMARFDGDGLADRLAETGALALDLMPGLAATVAAFHRDAERRPAHGGAAGMRWVVEGNRTAFDEFGDTLAAAPARAALAHDSAQALEAAAARLDRRQRDGLVRQCHGDLHLGNIVRLDGPLTPFDAVEFNDDISAIDVGYDLAFLLMDLWHRALPRHANLVLNEYVRLTGDLDNLALLPLFLSCRAAVRAKTSATAASLEREDTRGPLVAAAREYFALAQELLAPPAPVLVAVGGLSGSGKSTVAAGVAPRLGAAPGAVHLRTDVIRKMLAGVAPLARLPEAAYATDMTARVYGRLMSDAAAALGAGQAVICDGVFGLEQERRDLAAVAERAGVPFVPVWLEAPPPALEARVAARQDDASDATIDVVRAQVARTVPPEDWPRVDASGAAEANTARVIGGLRARGITCR